MDDIYKEIIIENYKNPMNAKEIIGAEQIKVFNQSCGDIIELQMKIENDIVIDVGHKSSGCAISIASMSILSDHIKNMNVNDVLKIEFNDIKELLGIDIGPGRIKCAMLSIKAVRKYLGYE